MTLHSGSCHCGAVRFEIEADIDHVRLCDCSVCSKRGALTFRVEPSAFRLLTLLDDLAVYRWGTMTGADYFCRTCGILPFRKPPRPSAEEAAAGVRPFEGWAVNARCLDRLDLTAIPIKAIAGRHIVIGDA